jgi:hypothetical protein
MLTHHKYIEILSDWDKDTIETCCKTENTDDPKCTDCCYDKWQDELNQVSSDYNVAIENANQLQKKVNYISGRRDKYIDWLDELDKAEYWAKETCDQLKLIAIQLEKIWYNSCKATEAIDILFCMIRDILMQTDIIKKCCDNLDNCIARNADPSLNGQGIQKYYLEYKGKLEAVIRLRESIIKDVVEAVVTANLITNGITTKDSKCSMPVNYCQDDFPFCVPPPPNHAYYGIKTIICEWYCAFKCTTPCPDPKPPYDPCHPPKPQPAPNNPCDEAEKNTECCKLLPTFDFPTCASPYREIIQGLADADSCSLKTLITDLNKANIKKESLQACKTSLENAIKAVNPKERCK